MDEYTLTKDADLLICGLYKEYLKRRRDNKPKSSAKSFGPADCIKEAAGLDWSTEDTEETCKELTRAGLLSCLFLDNTIGESKLTDKGIAYMENRFSDKLSSVISYIEKIRSLLPL